LKDWGHALSLGQGLVRLRLVVVIVIEVSAGTRLLVLFRALRLDDGRRG
jgi:hypothetical protein